MVDQVDRRALERGRAEPLHAASEHAKRLVSSGGVLGGVQVRIVDDEGRALGDRAVGQIAVRSPSMLRRYMGDAAATRIALCDGWYMTGDQGYVAGGELFVIGRCDDLILIAGRNLDPVDVEAAVNEVAGVVPGRCAAFGVTDEQLGTQRLVVIAETDDDDDAAFGDEVVDGRASLAESIRRAVIEQVGLAPDDVRVVEHMWLIKSTSGKIARRDNRQRYLEHFATDDAVCSTAADGADDGLIHAQVCDMLVSAGLVDRKQVEPAGDVPAGIELEPIESLRLVRLVVEIEKVFGVRMDFSQPQVLESFSDTARLSALIVGSRSRDGDDQAAAVKSELVDAREVKCRDFAAGPKDCELLIVGSSRVQSLSAKLARRLGYRAYNFSVESAWAEDWYCIGHFVRDHNAAPLRRVVLGIDIEAFTVGVGGIDYRLLQCESLRAYLDTEDRATDGATTDEAAGSDGQGGSNERRMHELLFDLRTRPGGGWRRFDFDPQNGDMMYDDGAGDWADRFNRREALRIADIHDCDVEYRLRMAHFRRLNPKRLEYFIRAMQMWLSAGTHVTCFLTPLHPSLHELLAAQTPYMDRMRDLVNGLRGNDSSLFELRDMTTTAKFGGSDDDFANAGHIGPANADLLLRCLLRPKSERAAA